MRKLIVLVLVALVLVALAAPSFASQYTCGAPPIPGYPLARC